MMQASPYPSQAGMGPGHPSMGHGHPMQVPQGGHMGHPNPMMGGMHHGMTGPQGTQGGPMVSNMPPNASTPAPGGQMGNAMAMAHLSAQGPMFQGQHPGMNMGQMLQQNNMTGQMGANMIARQRAMAAQMNGHMGGQMMGMQNPMNGMNAAQIQQMKMGMPMQHIQQMNPQQQQQHMLQQQARMHQQTILAQQHAQNQAILQQQRQHQAVQQQQAAQQQHQAQQAQAQQMQMSRSQSEAVVTQPPPPVSTPVPQAQPPPQPQSQPQNTPQPQQQTPQQKVQQPPPPQTTQPPPQNPPTPQIKQGDSDEESRPDIAKNQILMDEQAMRPNVNQDFSGQCILQLMLYYDHLAAPARPLDVSYWQDVMAKYYSPFAQMRQQIYNSKSGTDKQYQLRYPSLARFYHQHFKNGVKKIHMQSFEHSQNALPNGGYHVWSKKLFVTHEYENGIKVISYGSLQVNFDEMQKIESLFIGVKGWDEVIPRSLLESPPSPEQNRQSPKQSKKNLLKQQQVQRPLPRSPVGSYGIPHGLQQFLEIAEVITAMDPLIQYYCENDMSTPSEALKKYNEDRQQHPVNRGMQQQNANAAAVNGQIQFANQRMAMNPPNHFQSPALAHLNLPNQQSPHMNHTPSPGHPGQGGVQMVHQMSAQGSMSGSQGASTNTSPANNKRRRPSAIKEEDTVQANAGEGRTKPSPRVGKRQKGAAP